MDSETTAAAAISTPRPRRRRSRRGKNGKSAGGRWTTAQERYFVALDEWIGAGNPYSQKDVAALAGVAANRVSKWNRDESFRLEVARRLRDAIALPVERAHHGMLESARRGNPVAYREVMTALERQGRIATPAGVPGVDGRTMVPVQDAGGGVHVHVHAIPERRPMSELPPPMTLPAASSPATPGWNTNGGG